MADTDDARSRANDLLGTPDIRKSNRHSEGRKCMKGRCARQRCPVARSPTLRCDHLMPDELGKRVHSHCPNNFSTLLPRSLRGSIRNRNCGILCICSARSACRRSRYCVFINASASSLCSSALTETVMSELSGVTSTSVMVTTPHSGGHIRNTGAIILRTSDASISGRRGMDTA